MLGNQIKNWETRTEINVRVFTMESIQTNEKREPKSMTPAGAPAGDFVSAARLPESFGGNGFLYLQYFRILAAPCAGEHSLASGFLAVVRIAKK